MLAAIAAENVDWLFVAGDTGNITLFEDMTGSTPTFLIPGNCDVGEGYPRLPLEVHRSNIVSLSDPAAVRVGGLTVLLCHDFSVDMLRKRHLGPSDEVLDQDYLVLDFIPDIVGYGHDHKPLVSNYKSTTLVNAGSLLTQAVPVIVDFQSREWKQLKL
jgi:predicted phosphodiesterase